LPCHSIKKIDPWHGVGEGEEERKLQGIWIENLSNDKQVSE